MANRKLQARDSIKALKKKLNLKEYVEIRDRIRAVVFALKGRSDSDIADRLDYSLGWVKKWIARYSKAGFDGLYDQSRTGAPNLLTEKQMTTLYREILAGPDPDGILSRYRISDVVKLALKRFGVKYSRSGMHALMKRMKLSHVKPRPRHPKNDPVVMADWKKKRKNFWRNKLPFSQTKKSKSGIKTRRDLAKRGLSAKSGRSKG